MKRLYLPANGTKSLTIRYTTHSRTILTYFPVKTYSNSRVAHRHAPPPYSANSWRSFSTSCGTPTAPRSLICVRGLRIIAVSGFPGSTR